jgi:hypothetical protein
MLGLGTSFDMEHMILNGGPTWDFILVAIYSSLWIIKQKLRRVDTTKGHRVVV